VKAKDKTYSRPINIALVTGRRPSGVKKKPQEMTYMIQEGKKKTSAECMPYFLMCDRALC